jgi:hypothetical protein
MPAGVWYHLAYVYSGTSVFIYVNGTLSAASYQMWSSATLNTTRLYNYFGMASSHVTANVMLDEIRMYNKALTPVQVKLDMNSTYSSMISGMCSIATTVTTTSTSTKSTTTTVQSCAGHYWPIANQSVTDVITGLNATSLGSPQFVTDRNGVANGAIWVNSIATAWQLPVDTYYQGDTTVTMWLKKVACQFGVYGNITLSCYRNPLLDSPEIPMGN